MSKTAISIVQKYYPEVTKIVDAAQNIEVKVLPCKAGSRGTPDDCAMAKACKRQFHGAIISKAIAYLVNGDTAYRYRVPSSVRTEIVSFDRDHDFRPGEYWLKAPLTTEKIGAVRKRSAKSRSAKSKSQPPLKHHHAPDGVRTL